jgi:hypothetical protein
VGSVVTRKPPAFWGRSANTGPPLFVRRGTCGWALTVSTMCAPQRASWVLARKSRVKVLPVRISHRSVGCDEKRISGDWWRDAARRKAFLLLPLLTPFQDWCRNLRQQRRLEEAKKHSKRFGIFYRHFFR